MSFGQTLKTIRRDKGITQRAAANKIRMDYSYWSRLENDRLDSLPTAETVNDVARAIDCSESQLLALLIAAGRKCSHPDKAVKADILEGEGKRQVQWCEACGAYRFYWPKNSRYSQWREPRPDWYN